MNIDERLAALAQSGQFLLAAQRETDEKIRHLALIAEQNEVRAAHMMDAIGQLSRIAGRHETRIDRLEER